MGLLAKVWGWIHNWLLVIVVLLHRFRAVCKRQKYKGCPCEPPARLPLDVPDPLIYDQYYLMSLGLAVTWDNPDIRLKLGGVVVNPSDLQENTEYQIFARIWNSSPNAPVAGLRVVFQYLQYGIGTQPIPIGTTTQTTVDLEVLGYPPALAVVNWTTPSTPGHYCVQVHLEPFDDSNFNNNLGQLNTHVVTAQSPAVSSFALRNDSRVRRMFTFEADSYFVGEPPPCGPPESLLAGSRRIGRATLPPRHLYGSQPLPEGWLVQFEPTNPTLDPGEQITLSASVVPPVGYHGQQTVNLNAFAPAEFTGKRALAGGVTLTVIVP
jgi:hypothetical protein